MSVNTADCAKDRLGTGLPDCLADLGFPRGFILTKRTWSVANDTTIDKAYVLDNIQNGNFIPFIGSTGFEQNTPELTTQEFQDGILVPVRNGKPQYTFNYVNTVQFQKIVSSYNSYKQFNVILVFDNDVMFLADDGTNLSGFNLGMLNSNTYMFNDGSNVGQSMVQMQILDNKQFAEGGVVDPGFDLTSVNGIIDCLITDGSAIAGGDVTVKITAKANPSFNILGLGVDQFRLVVNGTAEVATAVTYNDVAGTYAITPTSTTVGADEVVVELYDDTNNDSVAKLGDQLYDGISDTIVVA